MHLCGVLLITFHDFDFGSVSIVTVSNKVEERFPEKTQAESVGESIDVKRENWPIDSY